MVSAISAGPKDKNLFEASPFYEQWQKENSQNFSFKVDLTELARSLVKSDKVPAVSIKDPAWYENTWLERWYKEYKNFFFHKSNPFFIDILSWILTIFFLLVFILTIYGIIAGTFYLFNFAFTPIDEGTGKITAKDYDEEDTTLTPFPIVTTHGTGTNVGMGFIPTTTPEEYQLLVEVAAVNKSAWMTVRKKFYKKANVGDMLKVKYRLGRLNGKMDIQQLSY